MSDIELGEEMYRRLHKQYEREREKNTVLMETVGWYADGKNWLLDVPTHFCSETGSPDERSTEAEVDDGVKAREALAKVRGMEKDDG